MPKKPQWRIALRTNAVEWSGRPVRDRCAQCAGRTSRTGTGGEETVMPAVATRELSEKVGVDRSEPRRMARSAVLGSEPLA